MFSLQELLGQEKGDEAVDQISQSVGADSSLVSTAISAALPHILNGLANNASSADGADSLNEALDQHDGSVLDNLGGLSSMIFGGGQQAAPPPQANAGGILGHILGGSQGAVAQDVSNKSGLDMGQVAQILMMLAPIVMGYLGRQKQEQGVGADGIGSILGSLLGGEHASAAQAPSSGILGMAEGMLDRDHDGSALDDLASMAFNYVANK